MSGMKEHGKRRNEDDDTSYSPQISYKKSFSSEDVAFARNRSVYQKCIYLILIHNSHIAQMLINCL